MMPTVLASTVGCVPTAKLTRTEVRQVQTRLRLREVAYQLMSAQGVDATTIQQITDGADIGFGTFYNYAPSKESLAQDVLDCMIHNVGQRNDLTTQQLGENDPVRIVANSVRFVIREMVTNPVYRWWVTRLDLLVARMRIGFAPFGLRDIQRAVATGQYDIIGDNRELAWSHLNWMMAAGGHDILHGVHRADDERSVVEAILRVMGVQHDAAHQATSTELPASPSLPIDFSFEIGR